MNIEAKLQARGLTLPSAPAPVGAYVPAVRTGELIFLSGQLPLAAGELVATGKVASEVSLESARAATVQACLNALAALKAALGSLEKVRRVVRMEVFVASARNFHDQAQVANAASELLQYLFGEAGRHTRIAVGVAELPLNAPVEIALIFAAEA